MKILITGASGFVGSFLCEEALKQGMETWAGMRKTSSRRYLQNEKLNFAFLDLTDTSILASQLNDYKKKVGRWDVIIHAGGATKCLHKEDFDKHNFVCTKNLVETLEAVGMLPDQFLYVSSLSVLGDIREKAVERHALERSFEYSLSHSIYEEMTNEDTPRPNTAYGASKVKSEQWLHDYEAKMSITIFRPTGVYGPREKDYFLMAKSIKQHSDFAVGYKPQEITFIYVRDLVSAIFAAIGKSGIAGGKTYAVADGYVYDSRAFSDLLQKEMGTRFVLHIKAPLWFLRVVCAVSDALAQLTGKMSALNNDKYNIMKQRNWQCDINPLRRDLGWEPVWNLEQGVREAVQWYKDNKWL